MRIVLLIVSAFCLGLPLSSDHVGLLVMATGKYAQFIEPLIRSARMHFCANHTVTYFVFTDGEIPQADDIVRVFQTRLGWPYDTMMRFHVYAANEMLYLDQDYLFACDADMLFVDTVGDEILGERVATLHPGFVGQKGSYCRDPRSLSYVSKGEGTYYFAGGFYGGARQEIMRIAHTLSQRIDQDLKLGVIPEWHDEAHWNRYCIDHPPTIILTPSYCYPEKWKLKYPKKLLALDKDHAAIRQKD
jgi:histo-blood group ABO system transferase